jgi:hypothetical protein
VSTSSMFSLANMGGLVGCPNMARIIWILVGALALAIIALMIFVPADSPWLVNMRTGG